MSSQNNLSAVLNTEHEGMVKTKVPLPPKFPFLKTSPPPVSFHAIHVFNIYIKQRHTHEPKNTFNNTSRTHHSGTAHKSSDIKPETMTINDTSLIDT